MIRIGLIRKNKFKCIKIHLLMRELEQVDFYNSEMIHSLHIFFENWSKCLYPAVESSLWFMQDCRGFF